MNRSSYTENDISALKANICDKKSWIADFGAKHNISSQVKAQIDAELSKLVTNGKPKDIFDVMLQLDIYSSGLQNIIWCLCKDHNTTPPECSFFTLRNI